VFFRTESAEPHLPFDEAVYDLVLSNLGLHEAEQPQRLLREMVRVARPGAAVLATLPLRGSFGEFYTLLGSLLKEQPRLAARLEVHLSSWPDAAAVCDWAAEAGLEDIDIVTAPFSILVAGGADLFFAPVIEYGPLSAWKAILGERGPAMQAAFSQLRESVDHACAGEGPFVLTIRAACLRGFKPRPPSPPSFEEDPTNAPTRPGS
jgi:SAM-dependent methyltransferase